jgi:hypothetical protein
LQLANAEVSHIAQALALADQADENKGLIVWPPLAKKTHSAA